MKNKKFTNIQKHSYVTACEEIDSILSPLKKFKIHMFSFIRNYIDGSQIYLSNNQQWIKNYYEHDLFKTSLFEHHPSQYKTGFIAWPLEDNSPVFLHGKKYFNSYYGVTFCEKHKNFSEFYFFSGADVPYLQNLFLNNKEIIHHFILYFKDRSRDLIKKSINCRIFIPRDYNCNVVKKNKNQILADIFPDLEKLKKDFFSESEIRSYYFSDKYEQIKKIAPRQLQFIVQLLNYKNISEIACIMNISHRTAEGYFNDIKSKFNCNTRFELIKKLSTIGLRAEYFLV